MSAPGESTSRDEAMEEKKEQLRRYMEADRKLEAEREKRRRGRAGCIGTIVRITAVLALFAGVGYLVWWWHPWGVEIDTYDAAERPGACSPGVSGTVTEEHFTLLGVRVYSQGGATICQE